MGEQHRGGEVRAAVLDCTGGALGPVARIMLADFYACGWNSQALAATAIGLIGVFVGVFAPLLLVAYAALMRAPETVSEPAMEIAEKLT